MTPTPKTPAQLEEESLDLLKIFFYVYSALVAFSTLVVAAIFAAMVAGFSVAAKDHGGTSGEAKAALGMVGVVLALVTVLLVAKVVAVILAGKFIGERTHYTFIFVVAIICCLNVPFGTALGVFTLITLTKDPIKRRFGQPG